MPLREIEAIVLRTYRLGEADKIVSMFSRQMGRVRAVASGAQRPKSRYGGTLEPLTYIKLWLFERENRDLLRINSAELLESFFAMQSDYNVQIAAQYLAEVSERLLPEREVNERAFRLLLAVLRGLKAPSPVDLALLYFNAWMLRLGGFMPALNQCSRCGRTLGDAAYAGSPGVLCAGCRSGSSQSLSPQAVELIESTRRLPFDRWAVEHGALPAVRGARLALENWVEICADKKLITRELIAEAL